MSLDIKFFPQYGNVNCSHSIGLYKSGRCRACGFKVMESVRKRAWKFGLKNLLKYGMSGVRANWDVMR